MNDSMVIEKGKMDLQGMAVLQETSLAPYIYLATNLIEKKRRSGGSMFRHQLATFAVLIEYGYFDDPVLLKASLIHDLIEDIEGFNQDEIQNIDKDGPAVLNLVLEVSKRAGETKGDFLKRISSEGSYNAKVLKCADRITNLTELGFVTGDGKFIERTCDDSEYYILGLALQVNFAMFKEIIHLLISRRQYLE